MNGISWAAKLAWVGMVFRVEDAVPDQLCEVRVRVRIPDGLVSFGDGDTLEEALEDAAIGFQMDWGSVARKMTDAAWADMAHC